MKRTVAAYALVAIGSLVLGYAVPAAGAPVLTWLPLSAAGALAVGFGVWTATR